ncbi:MAG: alpha/beta hydrolase [Gammaproteobacteria bacterium]|nr:alpha/beta hydrolase [Gammaproteobacteria bacterium]
MLRRATELANGKKLLRWFSIGFILILCCPAAAEEVTHRFNGLTLNANLEMAGGKSFSDGVVLILHGFMAHNKMEVIRTSQQALLDNDYSSLAINLSLSVDNRHGYYGCDQPQRHVQDDAIGEIGSWIAWLRERGTKRVILLGHSRGANQFMVYAAEKIDPEVSHMIFLAPGMGDEAEQAYFTRYGVSLDKTRTYVQAQINDGRGDQLLSDIDMLACPRATVTADSFNSYYSRDNRFRRFEHYLPRSPVPTLIISGSIDERQPNTQKLVTPYLDGMRIQLAVIEGAGHFFRDFNIEEAMEAAIEFIDE